MKDQPPEARNYFIACYAVSLIQGESILGTLIRYQMVKTTCERPSTSSMSAASPSTPTAEILGDPYDKKVPLPRIPNARPLGSRHNTHMGQYCHTGNSALGQFCLSDNGAVGQFSQQYRDTPRIVTSGPQRFIAFLDTHTKIMSDFPPQQCTY